MGGEKKLKNLRSWSTFRECFTAWLHFLVSHLRLQFLRSKLRGLQFKNWWMQEHHVGKIKGPQTKNQNKSNTSSCAALENLIKRKSTCKSVNFGVCIQNVHQYYLCRWLLRDVQHFQNPCVSFKCMSGTLSSVAIVLSPAGFFFLYDCPSLHYWVSQNLDIWLSVPAFCFCFSRDRSSYPLGFSSILKSRKPV